MIMQEILRGSGIKMSVVCCPDRCYFSCLSPDSIWIHPMWWNITSQIMNFPFCFWILSLCGRQNAFKLWVHLHLRNLLLCLYWFLSFFYSQVNCFRKNYAYDVHENEEGNMIINSYKHQHTIGSYFQLLKWNKYLQAWVNNIICVWLY